MMDILCSNICWSRVGGYHITAKIKFHNLHYFEAFLSRLDTAHNLKMESYSHFTTDIRTHTVTVTPFEVGAQTGHINQDNKKRLHTLHTFCTKDVRLKRFKENCLHYLFLALTISSILETKRHGPLQIILPHSAYL